MTFGRSDNMSVNPNYWTLLGTIKKLKEKENKCFICGSTENIVPHHLRQVKQTTDEYYDEDNLVLLCDRHHHEYHQQYSKVNLKTFCEFFRGNYIIRTKESEMSNIKKRMGVSMDIDLNMPLKVSKFNKFMKIINKNAKKTVKVSIDDELYGIRNFRDQNDKNILEIRGFKEGYVAPDYEKDNFTIHIDNGEQLKLTKFRKILKNLVANKNNVLKVSVKGKLHDIIQIKDREKYLIFVIDYLDESDIDDI